MYADSVRARTRHAIVCSSKTFSVLVLPFRMGGEAGRRGAGKGRRGRGGEELSGAEGGGGARQI